MASYSKQLLSGSTNGMPVKIVATATPGTLIHTAIAGTTAFDEIWCWLTNTNTSAVSVTVEFGDATSPDHHLIDTYSIPANSAPIPIVTGQVLQNAKTLNIFASVANVIVASGYVNRIS